MNSSKRNARRRGRIALGAVGGLLLMATPAVGQSSSLYGSPDARDAITLNRASWIFQPQQPPRELQLNDIITVIVNEKTRVFSQGDLQRRRNANLNAVLQDWIQLDDGKLHKGDNPTGDPAVAGQLTSQFRAQNTLETRDNLQFTIAATVVDIRPNGNIVLEAHRHFRNNEEEWDQALTGVVRREDILPTNTVLSEDIAELRIEKIEQGQVRDGYKRSWLMQILDRFAPW